MERRALRHWSARGAGARALGDEHHRSAQRGKADHRASRRSSAPDSERVATLRRLVRLDGERLELLSFLGIFRVRSLLILENTRPNALEDQRKDNVEEVRAFDHPGPALVVGTADENLLLAHVLLVRVELVAIPPPAPALLDDVLEPTEPVENTEEREIGVHMLGYEACVAVILLRYSLELARVHRLEHVVLAQRDSGLALRKHYMLE